MPPKPARVLAYARVSSRDQGDRGTSLDAQRERIERWCAGRGYPAPILFTEVESGGEEKREKRDELKRLLAEARPGELVVTIDVDRWTRDVVSGVADVRGLVARGVGWYGLEGEIDATTDAGKTALEQRAAGAAAERRNIRRRTLGARDRLRDQGLWVEGPAPYGYRRGSRAKRKQCHLEIVPEEAALIRRAFEMCVGGASVVDVVAWLNVEKGTDHDRIVAHRMLRNRVYCGEIRSSAKAWIPAQHPAIVSRDLFERAQLALRGRQKGGRKPSAEARTATWLLRGLGSCPDCGARMGASYSRNVPGYYACNTRTRHGTCSSAYGRVDRIDAQAGELALARLVELRVELARPANETTRAPLPDFAAQRSRLEAQRARAVRGFVSGALTEEDLRRERDRLDEQLGRVAVAEGAAARAAAAADPQARRRVLGEVGRIEGAWGRAGVELRRAALGILARSIRIYAAHVEIEWRTAEELASQATDAAHLFGGTDDLPPPEAPAKPRRGRR
jgi:site-specific DNA recombinase